MYLAYHLAEWMFIVPLPARLFAIFQTVFTLERFILFAKRVQEYSVLDVETNKTGEKMNCYLSSKVICTLDVSASRVNGSHQQSII